MVEETSWRKQKTVEELRHQSGFESNEDTLVERIQRRRLQWLGHVKAQRTLVSGTRKARKDREKDG